MAGVLASLTRTLCHEPTAPTKHNELRSRWAVVMLLCVGLFGSYYVYDIPSATESAMQAEFVRGNSTDGSTCVNGSAVIAPDDPTLDTFNNDFNLLYSLYSWPNIILPFFGGYIADVLGVRLMGVVFMTLIALGQLVVALGSSYIATAPQAAWWTMWIGRTLFGFGGESLSVVQSAFISQYFQGKEFAFAMGVNLALARVGSVANDYVSGAIAARTSVALAYWVGFGICACGVLASIAVFNVDVMAEQKLRKARGLPPLAGIGFFPTFGRFFTCRCRQKPTVAKAAVASEVDDSHSTKLLGDDGAAAGTAVADSAAAALEDQAGPTEEIRLSAVFTFPPIFWVLTLSCFTVYIGVLTFNNNAPTFVTQKYLTDRPIWTLCDADASPLYLRANSIISTTYLVAGFLSPVFGFLCDRFGYRALLNLLAATAITCVHITLGVSNVFPVAPLVFLGLTYSIYASALWPCIGIVIAAELQATAYGVVTAVQNFGQAVAPIVVSKLMPDSQCPTYDNCVAGWNRTELFFMCMGGTGIICGILLNMVDCCCTRYPVLNWTEDKIRARKKERGELDEDAERKPVHGDLAAAEGGDYVHLLQAGSSSVDVLPTSHHSGGYAAPTSVVLPPATTDAVRAYPSTSPAAATTTPMPILGRPPTTGSHPSADKSDSSSHGASGDVAGIARSIETKVADIVSRSRRDSAGSTGDARTRGARSSSVASTGVPQGGWHRDGMRSAAVALATGAGAGGTSLGGRTISGGRTVSGEGKAQDMLLAGGADGVGGGGEGGSGAV